MTDVLRGSDIERWPERLRDAGREEDALWVESFLGSAGAAYSARAFAEKVKRADAAEIEIKRLVDELGELRDDRNQWCRRAMDAECRLPDRDIPELSRLALENEGLRRVLEKIERLTTPARHVYHRTPAIRTLIREALQ